MIVTVAGLKGDTGKTTTAVCDGIARLRRRYAVGMARQTVAAHYVESGPGVWCDDASTLHFDLEAMCTGMCTGAGYEPTPQNMALLEKAARQLVALHPAMTLEVREDL